MLIVHNIDNNWPFKQLEYCCQIHTKRLQGEHCLNTTDTLKNDQTELMGVKKKALKNNHRAPFTLTQKIFEVQK